MSDPVVAVAPAPVVAQAPAAPSEKSALPCLECEMQAAAKGTCPNVSKTSVLGTTDPKKFGCSGFAPADQARCTALLDCVRSKHCANGFDPLPCLCGPGMDAPTCAQKPIKSLPGVCRDLYIAAANGGDVYTLFYSTDSTIGVANNLFTCDVDAHCSCP